ncbi:MAG: alanine:cation symporter family protein [Rickettsiales bacterium]|nr:alanine:cation symporter family protein [Rickettsiales bacterium]
MNFNVFLMFGNFLDRTLFYEVYGFPVLIILLIFTSIFFSVYLNFPGIALFKYSIANAISSGSDDSSANNGLLKSKQSLFTSLSSIVGMGSVAGVATAINTGGPGSILWLMIMMIFSMNTSFSETLLAVRHRNVDLEKKTIDCAPIRYIRKSLEEVGFLRFGFFLSIVYGVMYFIGLIGTQIYQVGEAVNLLTQFKLLSESRIIITVLFNLTVLVIIYGGITRMAQVFEKLLPVVCSIYLISVMVILVFNIKNLPMAVLTMVKEAFKIKSVTGGIVGAICTGVKRGTYSNESGLGSATTPYAAMNSANPLKQAGLGSLNPIFVGLMCMATGLIIVSSGIYLDPNSGNGIVMVKNAFSSVFSWFPYILSTIIPLLSLSLCISSAFGAQNVYQYYFGRKTIFLYFILQFTAILSSAFINLDEIIMVADTLYLSIAVPNIICLFLSRKIIKATYEENRKKLTVKTSRS